MACVVSPGGTFTWFAVSVYDRWISTAHSWIVNRLSFPAEIVDVDGSNGWWVQGYGSSGVGTGPMSAYLTISVPLDALLGYYRVDYNCAGVSPYTNYSSGFNEFNVCGPPVFIPPPPPEGPPPLPIVSSFPTCKFSPSDSGIGGAMS